MATGEFWSVDDPLKPWGLFDVQAKLKFPITITAWLADMASTYASHSIVSPDPLEVISSAHAAGVVTVFMQMKDGAPFIEGKKYPFTVRLVCADTQQDDRTLWLKITSR